MKEKASSSRTLKRVIQNLEGQKHLVVLSFLLALVSVAGTLFVPILVGRAIDEIVGYTHITHNITLRSLFYFYVKGRYEYEEFMFKLCSNRSSGIISFQLSGCKWCSSYCSKSYYSRFSSFSEYRYPY